MDADEWSSLKMSGIQKYINPYLGGNNLMLRYLTLDVMI